MLSFSTEKKSQRNDLFLLLILNGLAGGLLGVSNVTWQSMLEPAQVLAGVVKYPLDNPNYLYLSKAVTLPTYLTAFLLYITDSERLVAILLSGFLGMLSFQAISTLVFAINRDVFLSTLGTLLIYFADYLGIGIIYPIKLLGQIYTHGILGLSFTVLTMALIGANSYRLACFCLGLAPVVHLTLAAWLYLVVALSALYNRQFAKYVARECWPYFISGFAVTVLFFLYHYQPRDLPSGASTETKHEYLMSMVNFWDYHRRKFFDSTYRPVRIIAYGVVCCFLSMTASFIYLRSHQKSESLSFLFRAILISGILSLLFAVLTHLPQEFLPSYFIMLIPGRYFNFNNAVLMPIFIGLITMEINRPFRINFYSFLLFLISSLPSTRKIIHLPVLGFWLALFAAKTNVLGIFDFLHRASRPSIEKISDFLSLKTRASGFYGLALLAALAFLLVKEIPNPSYFYRYVTAPYPLLDRTNDPVYRETSLREGLLLTTGDFELLPLRVRRPLLLDAAWLDKLCYIPETGELWNRITKEVYGVDLLRPLEKRFRHRAKIVPRLHKKLWENRSVGQWQSIRRQFGATDILVKSDWRLNLPIIVRDPVKILYGIPPD